MQCFALENELGSDWPQKSDQYSRKFFQKNTFQKPATDSQAERNLARCVV